MMYSCDISKTGVLGMRREQAEQVSASVVAAVGAPSREGEHRQARGGGHRVD